MLQMKIADLLFEDNQGMSFDQELAHAGSFAGKHVGELDVAERKDAVLKSGGCSPCGSRRRREIELMPLRVRFRASIV